MCEGEGIGGGEKHHNKSFNSISVISWYKLNFNKIEKQEYDADLLWWYFFHEKDKSSVSLQITPVSYFIYGHISVKM